MIEAAKTLYAKVKEWAVTNPKQAAVTALVIIGVLFLVSCSPAKAQDYQGPTHTGHTPMMCKAPHLTENILKQETEEKAFDLLAQYDEKQLCVIFPFAIDVEIYAVIEKVKSPFFIEPRWIVAFLVPGAENNVPHYWMVKKSLRDDIVKTLKRGDM